MADRIKGLGQYTPGLPREWIENIVESDEGSNLPVVFTDDQGSGPGAEYPVLQVTRINTGDATTLGRPAIRAVAPGLVEPTIEVTNNVNLNDTYSNGNTVAMTSRSVLFYGPDNTGGSNFHSVAVASVGDRDSNGGSLWLTGGSTDTGGRTCGNVILYGGQSFSGGAPGKTQINPFYAQAVEIGNGGQGSLDIFSPTKTSLPSATQGTREAVTSITFEDSSATVGAASILIVDGDPSGQVTASRGSLAIDTANGALYQNTDGSTTWASR
jgi:hypothetical protein